MDRATTSTGREHVPSDLSMLSSRTDSLDWVTFTYNEEQITFKSVDADDHILRIMQHRSTFYEQDVLERVRERLSRRSLRGASLDVGAFIGTHSVYFAKFCDVARVLSFESNPASFLLFLHNIRANNVEDVVLPINKAIGADTGFASIVPGDDNNQGHSSVAFDSVEGSNSIRLSPLDDEVESILGNSCPVDLIKIDVEGAELEVLRGAMRTVRSHRPILCIEVHSGRNLREVLRILQDDRYWIIDCLGYSPTYIIEPTDAVVFRRVMVNVLWLVRAALPTRQARLYRWTRQRLRLLAKRFSTGRWSPASS